jgi:hypothetical protein
LDLEGPTIRLINQPINQPTNQPTDRPTNQPKSTAISGLFSPDNFHVLSIIPASTNFAIVCLNANS